MRNTNFTETQFERVLKSGRFAITAELNPPDSADPEEVYRAALILAGVCDGINAVDASGANCHMSSLSICALLTKVGYEPVYQISCRDRNRIAIQGDILGAAALGVRNLLCITGDDVSAGDHPGAKAVFDFDSIQLLRTARKMRDESMYLSGRKITKSPDLFLGAAANPFAPPYDWRPQRLAKKVAAGAQFIQTQYCFDVDKFKEYMRQVRDLGLHDLVYILVGVGPLRSHRAAEFMRSKVPGVVIPDKIVERLKKTPKKEQQKEGKLICMEIIDEVKDIEGVSGIHIMAYRQEELVSEIVLESGFLPRPIKK
ncbi:MAG: methylenetetrahydrofolate reductase [Chloroflexi bacterium]|jgi:methylenetetrahydrofolate reductase (NADPH)|nr:methylenetetrahydrofolate reductase [Chloroflexota bacterium]MBT3670316.1 methylenetetrahydrofolate reductase [Chloroflexota bacterium]MBT4002620.1 methylenetetrahydrofolate reductase [Chloroflexota bacterium]MBT4305504.1 methylenetetrahydrofolate reductase [Chloroflexota bacterium]MBT4533115.1 methylenetetrahydrofolate reductase [Chloroflexota bacterium]